MEKSVGKLSHRLITIQLTHLHVNSYFISKFYFGSGVMGLTDAQCKELIRTCEKLLARKLGLGSNFPIKLLHGRVTAMGVGIVVPET